MEFILELQTKTENFTMLIFCLEKTKNILELTQFSKTTMANVFDKTKHKFSIRDE